MSLPQMTPELSEVLLEAVGTISESDDHVLSVLDALVSDMESVGAVVGVDGLMDRWLARLAVIRTLHLASEHAANSAIVELGRVAGVPSRPQT